MNVNITALRILLVDDNPQFIDLLSFLLQELGIKHIQRAYTREEGLEAYHSFHPDVCLLDIELLPGQKDGADLAFAIRQENSLIPIIFLTSFFEDDYYDYVKPVRPSSFMDKELSRLKLLQAIELAVMQIERKPVMPPPKSSEDNTLSKRMISTPTAQFNSKQIFFRVGDVYKPFDIEQIDFFFADNNITYARIDARNFPTNVQLRVLADELAPKFLRCHKKYVVNVDRIESVLIKEEKVKIGDDLLTIGYAYKKRFFKDLNLLK